MWVLWRQPSILILADCLCLIDKNRGCGQTIVIKGNNLFFTNCNSFIILLLKPFIIPYSTSSVTKLLQLSPDFNFALFTYYESLPDPPPTYLHFPWNSSINLIFLFFFTFCFGVAFFISLSAFLCWTPILPSFPSTASLSYLLILSKRGILATGSISSILAKNSPFYSYFRQPVSLQRSSKALTTKMTPDSGLQGGAVNGYPRFLSLRCKIWRNSALGKSSLYTSSVDLKICSSGAIPETINRMNVCFECFQYCGEERSSKF